MASIISKLKAVLTLDNSEFKKGLNDSQKQTSNFGSSIKKLGGTIAGAFAAREVIQFAAELGKIGHQANNLDKVFYRLGLTMDELRRATGGAISDVELQKMSIQARNLGIDVQKLPSLFRFATQRAAETGESIDYLVNSIVTGIGRKSALVLDNLGISIIDIQKEVEKTGDFAQAAFNLIEREASKSVIPVEDAASGMDKLNTALDNLRNDAAKNSSMFNNMAGELAKIAEAARNAFGRSGAPFPEAANTIAAVARQIAFLNQKLVESGGLKYWQDELDAAILRMQRLQREAEILAGTGGVVSEDDILKSKEFLNILEASGPLVESFYKPITFGQMTGDAGITPMASLMPENLDLTAEAFDKATQSVINYRQEMKKTVKPVLELGDAISSSLAGAIAVMADSLGQLIGGDTEGALNSFISGIAGLMKQFGALLIAWGVAQLAIKASAGNPYVAIAAGAALVAIGGLMASKQSQVTGYSGGGGYGSYGGGSFGGGGFTEQREIVMVARGKDLITVLNKQNYQDYLGQP